MRDPVIVTLSRFQDLFDRFRASADQWHPDHVKVLIRDGEEIQDPACPHWLVANGKSPFQFSRNANIALEAFDESDILLVNDDVTFTQETADALRKVAYEHPKIGILSPQVDGAAKHPMQRASTSLLCDPMTAGSMVAFVCVYLKRAMINEIGKFDERFTVSYEDDDYCMRAHRAGWRVAVTGKVLVKHGAGGAYGGSESIRRVHGGYLAVLHENFSRFMSKWGGEA